MTPPVRPEATDNPRLARIRRNLARLKAANAPQEDVDAYLAMERVTPEQELAAMPRTMGENVRGGLQSALQGATFNLADELTAAGRAVTGEPFGEALAEERASLRGFREANPKSALGLELGGGLLSGLGAAKVATAGVPVARQAGRIAASGVGGGAIAGAGAGESAEGRVAGGAIGAGVGGLLGVLGSKLATSRVGDVAASGGRKLMDVLEEMAGTSGQPAMQQVAQRAAPVATGAPDFTAAAQRAATRALAPSGEFGPVRERLAEFTRQGMGEDVLTMNLGDDLAVRAARAAANQPGSEAGQMVSERLARQGGRLGEKVVQDIGDVTGLGGVPGPVRLQQMQRELGERVRPAFEAFRARPDIPLDPNDEAQRLFIERYIQPVIETRRLTGNLTDQSALSGEVVDAAFKNLQRDVRGVERAATSGTKNTAEAGWLKALRDRVLGAIEQVDPDYARVVNQYALDEEVGKVAQEGFEAGMGLVGRPVGSATVALSETTPAGQDAIRAGYATALQQRAGERASNVDLGDLAQFRDVARAVVGTPADRQRFVEVYGEDTYNRMVERLMPKIRAAAQNAAARGNSTTTKQLLDALAFGDDAMLDAVGQLATGNVRGFAGNVIGKALSPLDRAYRLGVGRTAGQTADILTTSGAENITDLLALLERRAQEDAARRAATGVVTGATQRTALTPEMR